MFQALRLSISVTLVLQDCQNAAGSSVPSNCLLPGQSPAYHPVTFSQNLQKCLWEEQLHVISLPLCSLESSSLQLPLFQPLYNTFKQTYFIFDPAFLVVLGRSIGLPQTTLLCLEAEFQWVLHFYHIFHLWRLYSVHPQIYLVIFMVSCSHLIFNTFLIFLCILNLLILYLISDYFNFSRI